MYMASFKLQVAIPYNIVRSNCFIYPYVFGELADILIKHVKVNAPDIYILYVCEKRISFPFANIGVFLEISHVRFVQNDEIYPEVQEVYYALWHFS